MSLRFNASKSQLLVFRKSIMCPPMSIPGVKTVDSLKLLGVTISHDLRWDEHFRNIIKKCNSRMYALRILRSICDNDQLCNVYKALIQSLLLYASPVFLNLPQTISKKVDSFIKRSHRLVHGDSCACPLSTCFKDLRFNCGARLFHLAEHNQCHPIHALIPPRLPRSGHYNVEFSSTSRGQSTFPIQMALHMNSQF